MSNLTKLTAIALFTIPSLLLPNIAKGNENQFDVCLEELTDSGVATEEAQTGCADALNPKDLSYCVSTITENTGIKATDALKNCYQVRRPVELGNCVVSIEKDILSPKSKASKSETSADTPVVASDSPIMMALNSCRASLLPNRHAECVVALSRTPEVSSPVKAMETCLSAEDFPRDLFPVN